MELDMRVATRVFTFFLICLGLSCWPQWYVVTVPQVNQETWKYFHLFHICCLSISLAHHVSCIMKKAKYKSPHAFSTTSHILKTTITSAQHSCSLQCFVWKMLPLTTAVTSCGLLTLFLSSPEPVWCFVWEGIDKSQKEPFAICRYFLCPSYVLLALSWAVDTDGGFLWLTSEEFFWSAGRLACLPHDSSLYPLFLPSPLPLDGYQITSIKNKAKRRAFKT